MTRRRKSAAAPSQFAGGDPIPTCELCGEMMYTRRGKRFCSDYCRKRSHWLQNGKKTPYRHRARPAKVPHLAGEKDAPPEPLPWV